MNTSKFKMDLEILLDDELEVVKGGITEISETTAALCSGCCLIAVGGSTDPVQPDVNFFQRRRPQYYVEEYF